MSIISYKEYKIANDKDYFVKNNMLLEMAQLDDISTLPVYFDDDDIEFLSSFPTPYWGRALHKRYDIFLRKALYERCKQRISVEQAIYDEYVRIIKDFCNRIYSNSKNKEYSNPTKKEIEINFESIKNLEETKNLNISDEEINKIDKKLISYWFNKKVLVKKHNEENLESKKTEDNKQFFELIKTHYITSSIRGRVKIPEVNPIDFQWDGEKFIITTQQQNAIKKISLNEKTIEITYDENYKNSIEGSTIEITYDYNSFNEEAIKNFAKLETYNIIKKHIPFPVKSENFDPDKEDDYDFGPKYGKIRAKSFIIRLIAKLEQDNNEPHFEGSGLEGSEGQYGYDLSGGFEDQKICTNEIKGFTVPVESTFIDSMKEFLSDNHHEYYGKTHEFKNYKDCLGEITGTPPNKTWKKSPDIVILAKYHKKDLYVENTKIFDNIIKFTRNETSENIKKMKEELIKEYGEEAYKDSIEKLNNLHDIKVNVEYTETERKQKFETIKDDNIKSKFKFAEEKKIKYMPVTGLDKQELSDSENLASQKKLITSRIYSAIKRATNAGEVEIVKFEYFKNGEKLIYEKDIYPMDTWEDVNKPSSNNEKNIYIINIKKDFGDTTQKQIDQYLEMDSRKDKNAKKFLIRETRNILNIISLEIANTIMEDLVKNKQISVPHQKNNYLDHPAKSQITHPEIGQSGHKAGNIVLPHQIKNIKFVGENGEVIEKAHDVGLVLPSKPHRPIKSELINDDDDDDDYKDDEEFDNPSYNNHDNDDKKEKTGYYGDTVILSREEHERYSQDLGVRSPGVKLNSNAKPQKSYPKDTPQYMKAYNLINAREDMQYKTLGTMKINNAQEMKANIVNKIKSLAQDSFNIDELNEESFRPIFIQSICEVYNKINSRKQKIENCFYSIIDYLEEQVTNNLRNPIVAYEEENLNADEIKEKYVALKEWLKWKVKSVIQKSILKNCEKSYESGSRRKQQILVQQMTNVGATISGEGEGGIDLEYITKNQTMATGNSVDLKNIFGNPEDKADTDKNLFPTKHSIETQKEKNKTKEEQDLVTYYVEEINKHIEYNFKNIFDKNNSDDELKYKIKSLVSDYVDVNKEIFAVISNKLKKYILSNIENMINDQEYIDSLKNNITEPITTTNIAPEPTTTITTTTTPPPRKSIRDYAKKKIN